MLLIINIKGVCIRFDKFEKRSARIKLNKGRLVASHHALSCSSSFSPVNNLYNRLRKYLTGGIDRFARLPGPRISCRRSFVEYAQNHEVTHNLPNRPAWVLHSCLPLMGHHPNIGRNSNHRLVDHSNVCCRTLQRHGGPVLLVQ